MKRALFLIFLLVACNRGERPAATATGVPPPATPDPARGKELLTRYGCNVCHVIPGIPGGGALGPSLAGVGSRPTISFGVVANDPANLARYVQEPAALNPQTGMPALGVSTADANDIAAYLMTLK